MIDIHTLNKKLLPELKEIAKDLGVPRYQKLKKQNEDQNFKDDEDDLEDIL